MERKEIQDREWHVVVDEAGNVVVWTLKLNESDAINEFVLNSIHMRPWVELETKGYTVRKVKLTEIK